MEAFQMAILVLADFSYPEKVLWVCVCVCPKQCKQPVSKSIKNSHNTEHFKLAKHLNRCFKMWWFGWQMSPVVLVTWTLVPQLTTLFGKFRSAVVLEMDVWSRWLYDKKALFQSQCSCSCSLWLSALGLQFKTCTLSLLLQPPCLPTMTVRDFLSLWSHKPK